MCAYASVWRTAAAVAEGEHHPEMAVRTSKVLAYPDGALLPFCSRFLFSNELLLTERGRAECVTSGKKGQKGLKRGQNHAYMFTR